MGAVTTASNSTSWTSSSSPKKKGKEQSGGKDVFLPRRLSVSLVKQHLPGQDGGATWRKKRPRVTGLRTGPATLNGGERRITCYS